MQYEKNTPELLGESIDATNRVVEVFKDGTDILIRYKESKHESRRPIAELQQYTFEDLIWTPFAAYKNLIDEM